MSETSKYKYNANGKLNCALSFTKPEYILQLAAVLGLREALCARIIQRKLNKATKAQAKAQKTLWIICIAEPPSAAKVADTESAAASTAPAPEAPAEQQPTHREERDSVLK